LHPVAIQHLRRLTGSFDERVFPWNPNDPKLWPHLILIQQTAKLADGSPMPEAGKNGWYGFRRAFATMNAERMDLLEVHALMQH
jgi:hypothetical protein